MSKNTFSLPVPLFLIFLVLKLTDTIDWSWWWVTAPLWIPLGIGLVLFLIGSAVLLFAEKKK